MIASQVAELSKIFLAQKILSGLYRRADLVDLVGLDHPEFLAVLVDLVGHCLQEDLVDRLVPFHLVDLVHLVGLYHQEDLVGLVDLVDLAILGFQEDLYHPEFLVDQ
jgi:hypothetical protein